ncbi:MAG: cytidylate kinase-like family protein [Lawsonibacter sp.]|nr:cytidylate kinase-like family protein [Lawsonibacter sp.]
MKKSVITVSREFGSGGRSIAKELAQRLGWDYYDKELVKEVATQTGFDPGFIEEHGEFASSGYALSYAMTEPGTPGVMNGMSVSDFLWCIQRDVILKLAGKGNCVIVGRCGDYILQEREDCAHIFVHAPLAFRADRIVRLYGESECSPEQRLQEKDKKRRVNYKHYTGREWGRAQNYHLTLDSAALGVERCPNIILNALELG